MEAIQRTILILKGCDNMPIQFLFRGGTAAQWTAANPVLADREMGLETDTKLFKIGNGVTAWNSR